MGNGSFALILLVIAGLLLYFMPALIAASRLHPNQTSITVLNLLLGWTLIGWVAALVWACTAIAPQAIVEPASTAPPIPKTLCPFCAEAIQPTAIKCKHCGSMLNGTRLPRT